MQSAGNPLGEKGEIILYHQTVKQHETQYDQQWQQPRDVAHSFKMKHLFSHFKLLILELISKANS
jgi:hypothetical protein